MFACPNNETSIGNPACDVAVTSVTFRLAFVWGISGRMNSYSGFRPYTTRLTQGLALAREASEETHIGI